MNCKTCGHESREHILPGGCVHGEAVEGTMYCCDCEKFEIAGGEGK